MFETITGGLVLAAVSALGFLASNHGPQFKTLAAWLLTGTAGAYFAMGVWTFAVIVTESAISTQLIEAGYIDASEVVSNGAASVELDKTLFLVGLPAFWIYILTLRFWVVGLKDNSKNPK